MPAPHASPYARALGVRIDELAPDLRRYFDTIPSGSVGRGEGVFTVFGSRFRWLDPLLRLLQSRGVVAAGLHRDIPFRIENRTVDGRAVAIRRIALPAGEWTMTDAVHLTSRGTVVDVIGTPATVAAEFDVTVDRGGLELRSRTVGLRWGALALRLPRAGSPVVRLQERTSADGERQQISLTIDAPILGRVYEYRGTFTYRIEEEQS